MFKKPLIEQNKEKIKRQKGGPLNADFESKASWKEKKMRENPNISPLANLGASIFNLIQSQM